MEAAACSGGGWGACAQGRGHLLSETTIEALSRHLFSPATPNVPEESSRRSVNHSACSVFHSVLRGSFRAAVNISPWDHDVESAFTESATHLDGQRFFPRLVASCMFDCCRVLIERGPRESGGHEGGDRDQHDTQRAHHFERLPSRAGCVLCPRKRTTASAPRRDRESGDDLERVRARGEGKGRVANLLVLRKQSPRAGRAPASAAARPRSRPGFPRAGLPPSWLGVVCV